MKSFSKILEEEILEEGEFSSTIEQFEQDLINEFKSLDVSIKVIPETSTQGYIKFTYNTPDKVEGETPENKYETCITIFNKVADKYKDDSFELDIRGGSVYKDGGETLYVIVQNDVKHTRDLAKDLFSKLTNIGWKSGAKTSKAGGVTKEINDSGISSVTLSIHNDDDSTFELLLYSDDIKSIDTKVLSSVVSQVKQDISNSGYSVVNVSDKGVSGYWTLTWHAYELTIE